MSFCILADHSSKYPISFWCSLLYLTILSASDMPNSV